MNSTEQKNAIKRYKKTGDIISKDIFESSFTVQYIPEQLNTEDKSLSTK